MALASTVPTRQFLGLLVRRPRWGLSGRGWILIALALIVGGLALPRVVYPFLAVTDRTEPGLLVVEGWVHEYAIRTAVEEYRRGGYSHIYSVGGPVTGTGGYTNDQHTAASVGADLLISAGLPQAVVRMVPSREMTHDRTFSSAVALRQWLREHQVPVGRLNVITEDVHARRSRLLFRKAFGEDVTVGVIAVPDPDYDWKHWWRYSEGIKEVVAEGAAYLYARFFFHPPAPGEGPAPSAAPPLSD